jgi:hypothetical protein
LPRQQTTAGWTLSTGAGRVGRRGPIPESTTGDGALSCLVPPNRFAPRQASGSPRSEPACASGGLELVATPPALVDGVRSRALWCCPFPRSDGPYGNTRRDQIPACGCGCIVPRRRGGRRRGSRGGRYRHRPPGPVHAPGTGGCPVGRSDALCCRPRRSAADHLAG